jgi:type I restriction enzyme, R subunit
MAKSEAQTRSELIDKQLLSAGWKVKDPTNVVEEFDILTALPEGVAEPRAPYEDQQFSDYVLRGKTAGHLQLLKPRDPARKPLYEQNCL